MPHALPFLVLALAGWVIRHQEDRIDYRREENRVLRGAPWSATVSPDRRPALLSTRGARYTAR